MKNQPLKFADTTIYPGTSVTVELPFTKLYTHTDVDIPVHVIHGKKSGPSMFVTAAIHGDEINGVEIIRRLLKLKSVKNLRGTLYAVPIVNVLGFLARSRYMPDRRDLNRMFPGADNGSLASRLAHLIQTEIVERCQYGIDLHTGANHRGNLPQIRAHCADAETLELARMFGAPVIINSDNMDGSLRESAYSSGVKSLLYEAGESLRFNEPSIQLGVKGVISVMRGIGMIPAASKPSKKVPNPVYTSSTVWVRAKSSGIVTNKMELGKAVSKGDRLASIVDPFAEKEISIKSPATGIIIGMLNLPLVHQGDALYHIARTEDAEEFEQMVENTLTQEDFGIPS